MVLKTLRRLPRLVLIGLGCLAGVFIREIFFIRIEGKLQIGDMVDALTTIITAIIVAGIVQRRFETEKTEKGIVTEQINECLSMAKSLVEKYGVGHLKRTLSKEAQDEITLQLRNLANNLALLESLLKESGMELLPKEQSEDISSVKKKFFSFKSAITKKFTRKPISTSPRDYYETEVAFNALRIGLQRLKLRVAGS
jgi:hypothetical protein